MLMSLAEAPLKVALVSDSIEELDGDEAFAAAQDVLLAGLADRGLPVGDWAIMAGMIDDPSWQRVIHPSIVRNIALQMATMAESHVRIFATVKVHDLLNGLT